MVDTLRLTIFLILTFVFAVDLTVSSGYHRGNTNLIPPVFFHEEGGFSYHKRNDLEVDLTALSIAKNIAQDIAAQPLVLFSQFSQGAIPNVSKPCMEDFNQFRYDVTALKPYATSMVDAFAKPPSGIKRGSIFWLGDYDECIDVTSPVSNVTGRTIKGRFGFLSIKGLEVLTGGQSIVAAICVPDTCSEIDIDILTYGYLAKYKITAFAVYPEKASWSNGAIAAIVILGVLGTLMLIGTFLDLLLKAMGKAKRYSVNCDINQPNERTGLLSNVDSGIYNTQGTGHNLLSGIGSNDKITLSQGKKPVWQEALLAFSLITNTRKLLSTSTAEGQLRSVNGMRVLSMWWVILGHTYVFTGTFLNNGLDALSTLPQRWTFQPLLQGTLSVDTFFFMSGLLVAYITLKKMRESDGRLNWFMFYFHRFWRLTPTYALFILIWTVLFRHFIKGPLEIMFNKGSNFRTLIEVCEDKWWTNLLYINNFYPSYGDVNQQCMGWSWYLANDMQFYILSPLFILLLYRWRRVGIVVSVATIISCIIARAVTVYELGIYLPDSQSPTKHVDEGYAKGSRPLYDKPYTRIAPYMVGMLLGYILQRTDCRVRVHKVFFLIGWCVAIALGLSVTYGLLDYYTDPHQGSVFASIMYISLDRFVWSLACAWVVFACSTGNGGLINDILSWNAWAPLGRLTYCAYIVHPAVLFYFLFNLKSTIHYDDNIGAFRFVGNMVMSYMVAYIYSMLIEAPMLGLERLVFRRR